MDLGSQIKRQREVKEWSQQILADKLHISRQSISKWEQNTALPSFTNIVAMSELFNISLDEFIKSDTQLAEQIDAKMKMSKILHAITVSALIAFMVFIGMKIASINIYDISSYFTDFGAILLIIVMFKLDWHKLDQIVSRNVIILIAITVVMFLIPAINDFIMSFIDGWKRAVIDSNFE
ncbi:helix-turn-helix domain-containing protein [Weissella paramesenteroides]|jgi:transcriptional regulator with XRE-family HTH domain|uniref:helix-turn-helix domain-containing protein n=1 Tax=Weissella paramesenteroides TaxID=1249 RepID=UPI002E7ACFDD|nr:helix-turn-helix transcriptional regulator [Weissella paramesenteroides]WPQ68015.1 helix-turn-helix transcriptional regulator [Weissella paramesenteroides]